MQHIPLPQTVTAKKRGFSPVVKIATGATLLGALGLGYVIHKNGPDETMEMAAEKFIDFKEGLDKRVKDLEPKINHASYKTKKYWNNLGMSLRDRTGYGWGDEYWYDSDDEDLI